MEAGSSKVIPRLAKPSSAILRRCRVVQDGLLEYNVHCTCQKVLTVGLLCHAVQLMTHAVKSRGLQGDIECCSGQKLTHGEEGTRAMPKKTGLVQLLIMAPFWLEKHLLALPMNSCQTLKVRDEITQCTASLKSCPKQAASAWQQARPSPERHNRSIILVAGKQNAWPQHRHDHRRICSGLRGLPEHHVDTDVARSRPLRDEAPVVAERKQDAPAHCLCNAGVAGARIRDPELDGTRAAVLRLGRR